VSPDAATSISSPWLVGPKLWSRVTATVFWKMVWQKLNSFLEQNSRPWIETENFCDVQFRMFFEFFFDAFFLNSAMPLVVLHFEFSKYFVQFEDHMTSAGLSLLTMD
jgi:hypothetical protein